MDAPIALVTGANAGIGLATARGVAERGYQTHLVCRDEARGKQALRDVAALAKPGAEPQLHLCDLSSRHDTRGLCASLRDDLPWLDVLVNNAGVLLRERHESIDGIELTIAVNHLAYVEMAHGLLPLLEDADSGRIVNVASEAHRGHRYEPHDLASGPHQNLEQAGPYNGWKTYGRSKLYNIQTTAALARRLAARDSPVRADCLHPGVVATNLFRGLPKFLQGGLKTILISPERGARTSLHLATAAGLDAPSGSYWAKSKPKQASREANDAGQQEDLWKATRALLEVVPA